MTSKEMLAHIAKILNQEEVTETCRHCGHVSTCDAHAKGCPRGELLELMRYDKRGGRWGLGEWVPRENTEDRVQADEPPLSDEQDDPPLGYEVAQMSDGRWKPGLLGTLTTYGHPFRSDAVRACWVHQNAQSDALLRRLRIEADALRGSTLQEMTKRSIRCTGVLGYFLEKVLAPALVEHESGPYSCLQAVVEAMKDQPPQTGAQIAEITGRDPAAVERACVAAFSMNLFLDATTPEDWATRYQHRDYRKI